MDNTLYIDGREIFQTYGMRMLEGSLASVVCHPPVKASSVHTYDWQEYDGLDADLSAIRLDAREVALRLSTDGDFARYTAFINDLSAQTYHSLRFDALDAQFQMRLVKFSSFDYYRSLGFISVTMSDDLPLQNYTGEQPTKGFQDNTGYTFDDLKFSDYGVLVIGGTMSEVARFGDVKQPLVRNVSTMKGQSADDTRLRYKANEVSLHCILKASDSVQFWRNWNALLHDISVAGANTLYVEEVNAKANFFYKGCEVSEFVADRQGVWMQFKLKIQLLNNLANREFAYTFPLVLGGGFSRFPLSLTLNLS